MSTDEFREPPSLYLPSANGDVWREGDVLVCTAGANLPHGASSATRRPTCRRAATSFIGTIR